MKKRENVIFFTIVVIEVALLIALLLGGRCGFFRRNASKNCATNGDADREVEGNMGDENGDTNGAYSENARYLQKEKVENLKDKEYYYDFSNERLDWYIKRDNNHGPSGCDDTLTLSDYGAYYLYNGNSEQKEQDEKTIYFTFDCGYENGYTEAILDVLKKEDVPACFFLTQTYIRDNIDIVKRMKQEGHQVGNHTVTHPTLSEKSYEEIVDEITGCADYMKAETGYDMDPYFRPPSGTYSARVLKIAQDLGYKNIFWSIVYLDYDVNNQPGADYVIEHFHKYHHDGAIVLMHNCSSSNAEALETVIEYLKGEGYRFASLNEIE